MLGRRGPADAAFTVPELVGLAAHRGPQRRGRHRRRADPRRHHQAAAARRARDRAAGRGAAHAGAPVPHHPGPHPRHRAGHRCAGRPATARPRSSSAACCSGRSATTASRSSDLPYDPAAGTVPNDGGRVRPGVYVAGWVKRGPTGFIGTNKSCAQETVERLLDDIDAGALPAPTRTRDDLAATLESRGVTPIDTTGWRAIDREERRRGMQRGRPRLKLVDPAELRRVAGDGSARPGYSSARRRRQKRG